MVYGGHPSLQNIESTVGRFNANRVLLVHATLWQICTWNGQHVVKEILASP